MERLMPYVEIVHTITSDNGKEFTGHGEIPKRWGRGFSSLPLITRGRGGSMNIQTGWFVSTFPRRLISMRFWGRM